MKNLWYMMILSCSYILPAFVVTFENKTNVTVKLEMHLTDKSIVDKKIVMAQSYQFVSFPDQSLDFVLFTSDEKDKNGNLYGSLKQNFKNISSNQVYTIALKDVPAHKIAATDHTEEFEMPATQEFTCTIEKKNIKDASSVKTQQTSSK